MIPGRSSSFQCSVCPPPSCGSLSIAPPSSAHLGSLRAKALVCYSVSVSWVMLGIWWIPNIYLFTYQMFCPSRCPAVGKASDFCLFFIPLALPICLTCQFPRLYSRMLGVGVIDHFPFVRPVCLSVWWHPLLSLLSRDAGDPLTVLYVSSLLLWASAAFSSALLGDQNKWRWSRVSDLCQRQPLCEVDSCAGGFQREG